MGKTAACVRLARWAGATATRQWLVQLELVPMCRRAFSPRLSRLAALQRCATSIR